MRRPEKWLALRVELVEGGGIDVWPRPGRMFAASRRHTFAQLAEAIDDSFGRWDRAHLHEFQMGEDVRIGPTNSDWELDIPIVDSERTRLSRLRVGMQFIYVFDLGDNWSHLCTVEAGNIDPLDSLGIVPDSPLPFFGWGTIPDQYGRRWDGDEGESEPPPDPRLSDLPPLRAYWGPRDRERPPRRDAGGSNVLPYRPAKPSSSING